MQNRNAYRPPSWESCWSTSPTQLTLLNNYRLDPTPENWKRLNDWQNSPEAYQAFTQWEQGQQTLAAQQAKTAGTVDK